MGLVLKAVPAETLDGRSRHSPEGMNFKARVDDVGWKQAVRERDDGSFDWTRNRPIDSEN